MIGSINRKIGEYRVRNEICEHCKTQNSLVATVYSKIFMLKIMPFVYGKTTSLSCLNCKKSFGSNDLINKNTNKKVSDLKDEAAHEWFTYIGYEILILGAIVAVVKEIQAIT